MSSSSSSVGAICVFLYLKHRKELFYFSKNINLKYAAATI